MSRTVIINGREYPEFRFAWEVGPVEPSGVRPFRVVKAPVPQPRTALGYGLLGPVAPPLVPPHHISVFYQTVPGKPGVSRFRWTYARGPA